MHASPTQTTYTELQLVYDTFNRDLFGNELPGCLITLQREKNTFGYFSFERFVDPSGRKADEIALNPSYFPTVPLVETLQTIAHEMVHHWQAHFGTPGRGRYHNKEWADKMESIGLMPSSTGQPGGRKTGDCMADYAIDGGPFLKSCSQLLANDEFRLSWYDRFPSAEAIRIGQSSFSLQVDPALGGSRSQIPALSLNLQLCETATDLVQATSDGASTSSPQEPANRTNRIRYSCGCDMRVWGKPGLRLLCMDCQKQFMPT